MLSRGNCLYTHATFPSFPYVSIIVCIVVWNILQNGHSVSENSTMITGAFGFPSICSVGLIAFNDISAAATVFFETAGATLGFDIYIPPAIKRPAMTIAPGIDKLLFCSIL